MYIVCSDLEGVFVPEIWINVAQKTGIEQLRLTTRDISDYDELMGHRLSVMDANNLKIGDITSVIQTMEPLEGARAFLDWLRSKTQVVILSDTFTQFAGPLMAKLGWPTLLCHTLSIGKDGTVTGYNIRIENSKHKAVKAFQDLNYKVLAMGDSYNDIAMLKAADTGILFDPPENVMADHPDLPVCSSYDQLRDKIARTLDADAGL